MTEQFYWESTFAIAMALKRLHPAADLQNVSLRMIYDWTVALPEFADDPSLANDGILAAIYQDWFEETLHDRQ
jgi:FeS assembly protein IscX